MLTTKQPPAQLGGAIGWFYAMFPGPPVKPSALGPWGYQPRDVPGAGGESGPAGIRPWAPAKSRVYRGKCSISAGAGTDPGCCELLASRTGAQSPTVTFQLSQACGWDCPGSCYRRHRISLTGCSVPCCHVGPFQWLQPGGRSMSLCRRGHVHCLMPESQSCRL